MGEGVDRSRVTVVLNHPRFPENIGSAARAVRNMGIGGLAVVRPENFDLDRVRMMATHAAGCVVEAIGVFEDLREALGPFHWVVGTTARLGGEREVVHTPARVAEMLIPISRENRIALLFGPEDRGLTNEEIRLCHLLVNIPTAELASLNLAQAIMVLCYEIFKAGSEEPPPFVPRLASRHERDGMYDQLREILVRIDYINAENPDYWMNRFRRFFTRLQLKAADVALIRGVCRQVDWYGRKCRAEGVEEGKGKRCD